MERVSVTTTPKNLATELGMSAGELWLGRAQIRGVNDVYRTRKATAPAPATETASAWCHASGSEFPLRVDGSGQTPTWVWTSSGKATLILEPGAEQ